MVHYPPRSRFEKGFSRTSLWNNWNNHWNQTRGNLFGRGEWMEPGSRCLNSPAIRIRRGAKIASETWCVTSLWNKKLEVKKYRRHLFVAKINDSFFLIRIEDEWDDTPWGLLNLEEMRLAIPTWIETPEVMCCLGDLMNFFVWGTSSFGLKLQV